MPIYTNNPRFGGDFASRVEDLLRQCTSSTIASGYTSEDIVAKHQRDFERIAKKRGDVTLLIGMALFEGLHESTFDRLTSLNDDLLYANPNCGGVRVMWHPTGYHGKIYRFKMNDKTLYFAGSSNFSRGGLINNLEFTSPITAETVIRETERYLNWLLDPQQSVNISKVQSFPIIERATISPKKKKGKIGKITALGPPGTPYVDISLSRVDRQPRSNLNAFFGKGRWQRSTGVVISRDWFEVEIIADVGTTQNPNYPKGDFLARTVDGETFPCRTQGDHYKNLRSRRDLKILGRWIKEKLQISGALRPFEPVTSKTLQIYGRDHIRLYKLSDSEYLLDF